MKPELLAPAGNFEKMKTAFAFGADAVYLGIPDFSLRVRINDFSIADIKKAVKYAHDTSKRVYVTVNIFAHNKQLKKLPNYIKELKSIKLDGLFVSDPGVLAVVKKIWPKANIILSTQANCTNWQSAKFWQSQGVSRVILGRELSLEEVREIKKNVPGLEIETFVHGALCMSYSGRCFLSKFYNERSANLGDCSQPCRWSYKRMATNRPQMATNKNTKGRELLIKAEGHEMVELVEEEHGSYILNSKDLCLIKRLPELMVAGIDAFKIEGRAKSVYYLANVVGAYRRAIDLIRSEFPNNIRMPRISNTRIKKELEVLYKELEEKLYHRGYTEGFMFGEGKLAQNLENSHNVPRWEFCGQVYNATPFAKATEVKNAANYMQIPQITNNANLVCVRVHNTMKVEDEIEIIQPGYDIIKLKLKKMVDAKTGENVKEAHGGGSEDVVLIEADREVPEYSVIRRKIKKSTNP